MDRAPGQGRVAVGGSLDGAADFEGRTRNWPTGAAGWPTVRLDDLCLLPHTSGTTGRPKGVMLTHGNVTWNVVNLLTCADFRSDDVTMALTPFFRVGGTGVLSEAALVALLLQPESALSKVGSAGTPPLFVDTKIVGPRQAGELLVRGPNVMAGYWNRPEETAEVLTPDGWLRTGDAARPDEDGYIWIVGRIADSFTSHGEVVHPGDVERVLLTHPAVADAGVAAVSESGREQVAKAFVVVAPGAETTERELLAWCRDHLAAPQVPAFVTFVDRLPRNSVGKLIRAELHNAAALGR